MKKTHSDCYAIYENYVLTFGNSLIERTVKISQGNIAPLYILNKKDGFKWTGKSDNGDESCLKGFLCDTDVKTSVTFFVHSDTFFAEIMLSGSRISLKWVFSVLPKIPVINTQLFIKSTKSDADMLFDGDCVDAFSLSEKHIKLKTVKLNDKTDFCDNLVETQTEMPFSEKFYEGEMFILDDYSRTQQMLVVREGMRYADEKQKAGILLRPQHSVSVIGSGMDLGDTDGEFVPCWSVSVCVAASDEVLKNYKRFYKLSARNREPVIMSNTWGDRSQDKAVNEAFMLCEIAAAEKAGVDIVQIDDGWQKGKSGGSAYTNAGLWEGFHEIPDFWEVDKDKFPNGFDVIIEELKKRNMGLGLWFAPDSKDDFKNWERDADIIVSLHKKYNAVHFKLDSIKILNKKCELNIVKMLDRILSESNGAIRFNLDITASRRLGYLYQKQYDLLFIENRYTDWGNYYPHRTLRNLWQLSEFLPANKFQFEFLNLRRNPQKYSGDTFAPDNYSMDYAFATVMMSNPLVWMEVQNLSEKDLKKLADIVKVYKSIRGNLTDADIIPVGDMPDGMSFTGFDAKCSTSEGYLLLFRENTADSCYDFKIMNVKKTEQLYGSGNVAIRNTPQSISVDFSQKRSFALVKYYK